jgi:hypothetical protein
MVDLKASLLLEEEAARPVVDDFRAMRNRLDSINTTITHTWP